MKLCQEERLSSMPAKYPERKLSNSTLKRNDIKEVAPGFFDCHPDNLRNPHMQNSSEHIHDCNHPDGCRKICIQTNFGMVNMNSNSNNTNTSQIDNCGNRNQCWSSLPLISCCLTKWSHLSDSDDHSVARIIDPASIDEGLHLSSLEPHGMYLLTYNHRTQIPSLSRFSSPNSYRPPFP